ncbi:hypothetical protein QK363_25420 [Pseudomonas aeruginosa]|nr:hypothetical protein [Pseudomonas aeruginosa]MDI3761143.1 hypothetical protein [Pseudomonas aeruginosa]MDI3870530.1 hypothetical protein [Pseudomonas aeruginosa]MDI3967357.1 hypothetical protein [Pseudomonas aeruginosa]MDI4048383.1 hypothetical protein [Pseudomonas aeruginosa]
MGAQRPEVFRQLLADDGIECVLGVRTVDADYRNAILQQLKADEYLFLGIHGFSRLIVSLYETGFRFPINHSD